MDGALISRVLSSAVGLVLPLSCAGCSRPGPSICPSCRAELAGLALPQLGTVAPSPIPPGWPGCTGTLRYAGVSARLMKSFKDGGRRDLTGPLARLLADSVGRAVTAVPHMGLHQPILLVPIPSSPAAVRLRGDRPMLVLTRRVATILGPAVAVAPALSMAHGTADQAGLDRAGRQTNLRSAMRVRQVERVQGRDCVLVDDVLTSGATLSEGQRALQAAGARRVGMAVCMVTQRRSAALALPL